MDILFFMLFILFTLLSISNLILDSLEGEEYGFSVIVLTALATLFLMMYCLSTYKNIKADTVYDGTEFDWVYRQGNADSLGFSGGLFVDDKRLLAGAPAGVKIDLGSKGSMVQFRNEVSSYNGKRVGQYYVAYSGSKIYILNPRDRQPAKPYLYIKRYNEFFPVSFNGFNAFNNITKSKVLLDDFGVFTAPFYSSFGMPVERNGESSFIYDVNGNGELQTSSVRGVMPRPGSWNYGSSDILWGNGVDSKQSFWHVPSKIIDTYNVGYVEKIDGEIREMTPDDVSTSKDFEDEMNFIRTNSGVFAKTKEEYDKAKEERKKIELKKKEEEEKMGFWGKLFKPIGEFFAKFWEIFVYDDKKVKQSFKTALSYMDRKLSASNPVNKGGAGLGSGAERAGNFIFDKLFIADEGYTELGQKGLAYGTTLNTFYVNKGAWRSMLKLFLEAMYTMAFFLYIWKKKEKIAK